MGIILLSIAVLTQFFFLQIVNSFTFLRQKYYTFRKQILNQCPLRYTLWPRFHKNRKIDGRSLEKKEFGMLLGMRIADGRRSKKRETLNSF